jgi:hypothetical protein
MRKFSQEFSKKKNRVVEQEYKHCLKIQCKNVKDIKIKRIFRSVENFLSEFFENVLEFLNIFLNKFNCCVEFLF